MKQFYDIGYISAAGRKLRCVKALVLRTSDRTVLRGVKRLILRTTLCQSMHRCVKEPGQKMTRQMYSKRTSRQAGYRFTSVRPRPVLRRLPTLKDIPKLRPMRSLPYGYSKGNGRPSTSAALAYLKQRLSEPMNMLKPGAWKPSTAPIDEPKVDMA